MLKLTLITSKNICCILVAVALLYLSACKNQDSDKTPSNNPAYQPKGDLSDLVYNPVREDGSIDSSYLPVIRWEQTEFDFGTIYEGDIVKQSFTFTNIGTAPLLITNGTSTCGCTVPEWPTKPIPVDSSGTVLVKFDSNGKPGAQNKQVTIFANTYPNKSILTIKGMVEKSNQ